MKRLVAPIFALALASAWNRPAAAGEPVVVLTSFQPLYSFAWQVSRGSRTLAVRNLAPRALGPHDYDPSAPEHYPAFAVAVRRADAVVTLRSMRLARPFDRIYPLARSLKIRIVEIDPAVTWNRDAPRMMQIPDPGGKGTNPHIWLSLSHAALLVANLASDLEALDPRSAALYRANAAAYRRRLLAVRARWTRRFSRLERAEVAAITEGFPYLTADMGIHVSEYLLDTSDRVDLTRRIRWSGARVVLAEQEPAKEVADAVKRAGSRVVILSTLEEGWGKTGQLDPDGFLKGMEANLKTLYRALVRANR